jgi:hypothetical protein
MRNDRSFPSWLKDSVMVGGYEDGSFLFLNLRRHNPFLTVGQSGIDPAAMTPLIKVAYERSMGVNTWTKKPFKSDEPAVMYMGKKIRYAGKGRFEAENFVPDIITHILDQFPQHYWLDSILHPYLQTDDGNIFNPKPVRNLDGTPKYPKELWVALMSALGASFQVLDKDQIREMRIRKADGLDTVIDGLERLMEHAPRDQHKFIMQAIKDKAADKHKTLHEFERE